MTIATSYETISAIRTELRSGGEGPPMLFLHGGHGLEAHDGFLSALAEQARVIAPALPGFGATDWPQEIRTIGDLSCFTLDVADQLSLDGATIVASGFGGWIALDLLVRGGGPFACAVLVDAIGVKFADRLSRDIADLHSLEEAEVTRRLFSDPQVLQRDATKLSDDELTAIARARETFTYFGWKPYMHDPSLRRWLRRIAVPTLVAWGAEDGFVAPEYGRILAAAIPGARFELIEGAGHYPPIEQPTALAALIGAFIANSGGEAAA